FYASHILHRLRQSARFVTDFSALISALQLLHWRIFPPTAVHISAPVSSPSVLLQTWGLRHPTRPTAAIPPTVGVYAAGLATAFGTGAPSRCEHPSEDSVLRVVGSGSRIRVGGDPIDAEVGALAGEVEISLGTVHSGHRSDLLGERPVVSAGAVEEHGRG